VLLQAAAAGEMEMVNIDEFRMDRTKLEVLTLAEADDYSDVAYWETQPEYKRLAFLEFLRRSFHGQRTGHRRRLPRILEVVDGP
jgi:hypothetical protein